MTRLFHLTALACIVTAPAFADGHASGDAEAGEKAFRQCKSCHSVVNTDTDETLIKGGKTGPNLWGIVGATAGTNADFKRYKDSIVAAGEAGLVWDEAQFVEYVQDPTKFLRATLDDNKARSGMTFKVRKEEDAVNLWAYLASVSPAPES